ncbi:MAG: TIGR04283 family arsenosugar biosynthesis glycosyltransferase [Finegoldia sp.]|nr:TIGR04283 family arsenosugar biosynthesis glycosyltransferase [Finegoldia sp.]
MISVIIPVYNEEKNIESFLDKLEVIEGEREFIFSVSGDDRSYEIIKARGYNALRSDKGRGRQVVAGIKKSCGDKILVLHSDTFFKENPLPEIERILKDNKLGCFTLAFTSSNPYMNIVAKNSTRRVKYRNIAFGDQGMFFTRDLYDELGGFREIDLMEDYDFSIRAKEKGYKIGLSEHKIYTSARRFEENGITKTIIKMQKCQKMFREGYPIDEIKRKYR